jgi:hypothetical protein
MARWHRIPAERRTRELVSWSIGLVVVLVTVLLAHWAAQRLGWAWP